MPVLKTIIVEITIGTVIVNAEGPDHYAYTLGKIKPLFEKLDADKTLSVSVTSVTMKER